MSIKKSVFSPSVLVSALLLTFFFLLASTARQTSLVYDEVIYAPVGSLYLTTNNFQWNAEHPPVQKILSALPLLSQPLNTANLDPQKTSQWLAGYQIYFQSPTKAPVLTRLARWPSIVISLILAMCIFFWGFREGKMAYGVLALAVFVWDPLVLGNGALALNDIFVTAFSFLSVLFFLLWLKEPKPDLKKMVLAGGFSGLAVGSKFSAVLLGVIFLLLLILYWKEIPVKKRGVRFLHGGALLLTGLFVLLSFYGFQWTALRDGFMHTAHLMTEEKNQGYLLGSLDGDDTWFYYPVALFIKTPIPLLVLWIGALFLLFKQKKRSRFELALLIPPVVFFLAVVLTKNHFGVRYLLPAIPFLALLVGRSWGQLKKKSERWGCLALVVWLGLEALINHPHHMAYFNAFVGGSRQGYHWLDGSNQDWGQDLPALARYVKEENVDSVLMGYWGCNDPKEWGIPYQDVISATLANRVRSSDMAPVDVKKEILVVSAYLLKNPFIKDVYTWLKDKTPQAVLGHTLFVYDISTDVKATIKLASLYAATRRPDLEKRQLKRALFLDPQNQFVKNVMKKRPL